MASETLWIRAGEAMGSLFSTCPHFDFSLDESGWIVATGEQVSDFNCAYISPKGNPKRKLEQFVAQFAELGCPFLICVHESVALKVHLTAHRLGLTSIGELPLMVRDISPAETQGEHHISIVQMSWDSEFEEAVQIGSQSFGIKPEILAKVVNPKVLDLPSVRMYLARLNGVPAGMVTTSGHPDSTGIWSMVTAPEARRRGVATALVTHLLNEKVGAGCYFLLATEQGRPLYEKLGFQAVSSGRIWVGGVA